MIRVAAAPSLTWELLPAVLAPVVEKAGLSLPRPAAVVSARTPSSAVTVT